MNTRNLPRGKMVKITYKNKQIGAREIPHQFTFNTTHAKKNKNKNGSPHSDWEAYIYL